MSIFVALGANLPSPAGPPLATLEAALAALAGEGVSVLARSRWYRSPSSPPSDQPEYVNGVASLATDLDAAELLGLLHRVEDRFGRLRGATNAPRTLDLDLLDHEGAIAGGDRGVILPHPRLHARAFVLKPLAEIAPGWRHPVSRRGIAELISALPANAVAEPLPLPGNA